MNITDINTSDVNEIRQNLIYAIEGKKSHFQFEHCLANGTIRDVDVSSGIINIKGKKMLFSAIMDITEQKRAEDAIRESEIKFNSIFESSPAAHALYKMDGKIFDVNNAFCQITGYSKDELIGKTLEDINLVSINDKPKLIQTMQETKGNFNNLEITVNRANKEQRSILLFRRMVHVRQEQYILSTAIDITERRVAEYLIKEQNEEIKAQNEEYAQINEELNQLNEELNAARKKAEEADRLKTAFLQNMSHEIRTPMNAIMGFSDLLVKNYNNKQKLEKFAGIINQRCNDLLEIINDLLDIAKIESGQLTVDLEECDLHSLFSELTVFFKEHQHRLGKHQIKFSLHAICEKTECIIATDRIKLKQILINLITNAFKFTETGKIEGGCHIDGSQWILFYVTDTGIGIPVEKQQVVFDRFIQLRQNKEQSSRGTGLGLSIVKGLVQLLGGEVWLESEAGFGTTFYFKLPYIKPNLNQVKNIQPAEIKEFNFINKTVLVVEDDTFNAVFIKEVLSSTEINVLHTTLGNEAIKIALNQKPDLILMDIRLPDIDGLDAVQQIKRDLPDIKIIAQTAYAGSEDKKRCLAAGCCDFISKPIKPDLLLLLIDKYLT